MAEVPLSEDEVLSAEETARLLGIDILKVRRLALQGRIPAYRIPGGRKYKFFRSEVVAYATAVAEEAKAKAAADAIASSGPEGALGDASDGASVAVPVASGASSGAEGVPGDASDGASVAVPVASGASSGPEGTPGSAPDGTSVAVPVVADAPSSDLDGTPDDAPDGAPIAVPVAEETAG